MIRCLAATCAAVLASLTFADEGCDPQRLISPPEIPTSGYGKQVVTNGEYWFVSDSGASTRCMGSSFECGTGAVFIYTMNDGRLQLVQTLVPPNVQLYDAFGVSLDVDGDRLIVGIMNAQWPGGGFRQGGAYIYELEDGQWVEVARLEPPAEVTERFGLTVVMSGDVAIVRSAMPSRVYSYEHSEGEWLLRDILALPDGLTRDDCFGCIGVADEGWFFISAYRDSTASREAGSVYAYRRRSDNTLEFVQKIEAVDTGRFGLGIDFDGQTLAIGAYHSHRSVDYQGVVRTYLFDGERWVFDQEITHADPEELDQLGVTVAVQGDQMLATAFGDTSPPSVAGRVYRFERDADGQWRETGTLEASPPVIARSYGTTMAFVENHALIGAMREVDASFREIGAAYFFDLACSDCAVDLDADGTLTIFDFLAFFNAFDAGDPIADFDGDGELTIFDFLAFQMAFDAGCE